MIIPKHPGSNPVSAIVWPGDHHVRNQVQQTKGSAKPQAAFVLPSTQPNQSAVPPRTTPQHVSNIHVITRKRAGQKTITVQFNHPAGDPYFAGANVYLRRAGQDPVQMASGARSPISFTVPVHSAPHAVYISSFGNWGETDVLRSPSRRVPLN